MPEVAQYDSKSISITLGGHVVTGTADGTFVTVSMTADAFTSVAGADGEIVRSNTNDNRGTIVVTLLQSSQSNDVLSTLHNTDKLSNVGLFPVFIRDQNGTTACAAARAWVRKSTDVSFAKDIQMREWTIDCANLNIFAGGTNVTA